MSAEAVARAADHLEQIASAMGETRHDVLLAGLLEPLPRLSRAEVCWLASKRVAWWLGADWAEVERLLIERDKDGESAD